MLPLLDPVARTVLAQVGRACKAAVLPTGLPRVQVWRRPRLSDFFGSDERLMWAKGKVPNEKWEVWRRRICMMAALDGNLEVLRWALVNDCPWDTWTCASPLWRAPGGVEVGAGA